MRRYSCLTGLPSTPRRHDCTHPSSSHPSSSNDVPLFFVDCIRTVPPGISSRVTGRSVPSLTVTVTQHLRSCIVSAHRPRLDMRPCASSTRYHTPSCAQPSYICLSSTLLPLYAPSLVTSSPTLPKGTPTSFRQLPPIFLRISSPSIAPCPSKPCTPAWHLL
jgi:hypothetical protein